MAVLIKKARIEEIEVTCATGDGAILKFDDFVYGDADNEESSVWLTLNYPRGHRLRGDRADVTFKLTRTDAKKLFAELQVWIDE